MAKKGDFIGFTFNGIHSSTLGLYRVSNGSRYNETLLPEFSDKTTVVAGADRVNYSGTEYGKKTFPIEIAFDSVTEKQLRQIKQLFSTKIPQDLVFDELPYKVYKAKASTQPSISFICFDEKDKDGNLIRIYKGEGRIDLVSYYPYGFCQPNYLDIHKEDPELNQDEWVESSGLLTEIDTKEIYNPGDYDTPFKVTIAASPVENQTYVTIPAAAMKLGEKVLTWREFNLKDDDTHVCFNSGNQLIEGYRSIRDENGNFVCLEKTKNIYNKYLDKGHWFLIPMGQERTNLLITTKVIENEEEIDKEVDFTLEYKILYI